MVVSRFSSRKLGLFIAKSSPEDLSRIAELIGERKVAPVIDSVYSLSQVPEAIRRSEEGHARGKIVIGVSRKEEGEPPNV